MDPGEVTLSATDPANPVLIDSLVVDARTTNSVKVSEDGGICVISREGASNRRNGIVIVDCTDPRNIEIISTDRRPAARHTSGVGSDWQAGRRNRSMEDGKMKMRVVLLIATLTAWACQPATNDPAPENEPGWRWSDEQVLKTVNAVHAGRSLGGSRPVDSKIC